jgi:hypothetical protein
VAQDATLRRITVSNDDGDVYFESSGDGSEIVLKTEKVRVDGDVYCGSSTVGLLAHIDALKTKDDALADRIASIQPPKCMEPGGAKLQFNGTYWFCVCNQNWSGSSCESSWMREAKLNASSTAYISFGYSVAAFENTLIVGAPYEGSGNVYMYSLSDDSWTLQAKIQSPQGDDYDRFGYAVDVVEDTMAIGAIEDESNCGQQNPSADSCGTGSVYVFVRSGTAWTQQAKLIASDGASGDNFGSAISISGNDIAVGALVGSGYSRSGSAYVFSRTGDTWTETAKIGASDGSPNGFGISIAISGDDLVVGAHGDEEKGSVYIFRRSSGTWTEKAKVQETQTNAGAFGQAVSIFGDTLVVSAPYDDNNGKSGSGSAHVFTRVADTWTKKATLTAGSDSQTSDQFGYSISISGDLIALGAPGHGADESWMGDASTGPGAVYVFRQIDGTWSKEAKLMIGTDAGSYDSLGKAVRINSNGTVFAGAPPRNGGSVYVFSFKA